MRLGVYLLECQRGFVSILVPEIVVHAEVCLPSQLVAGLAVWDALDDSTLQRRTIISGWVTPWIKTYEITKCEVICF